MSILLFLIFLTPVLLFGIADLKSELKQGNRKFAVIYAALATCAVILFVCVIRGVALKSPSELVAAAVRSIFPPLE